LENLNEDEELPKWRPQGFERLVKDLEMGSFRPLQNNKEENSVGLKFKCFEYYKYLEDVEWK
jgi:hypothetical protein